MNRPQKKAINLSINQILLEQCRAIGIKNFSHILEENLKTELKVAEETKWRHENRKAIASYNKFIEENGVFGDTAGAFHGSV